MSDIKTIQRLREEGKSCSQVMVIMVMEKLGIQDEYLVRATKGLGGGMGVGHACGILTGIACGFCLADEKKGREEMFPELYQWFNENYGDAHGGINCTQLLDGDQSNKSVICPGMIEQTWEKSLEILSRHGFIPAVV